MYEIVGMLLNMLLPLFITKYVHYYCLESFFKCKYSQLFWALNAIIKKTIIAHCINFLSQYYCNLKCINLYC